jgi:hypothetical protein
LIKQKTKVEKKTKYIFVRECNVEEKFRMHREEQEVVILEAIILPFAETASTNQQFCRNGQR